MHGSVSNGVTIRFWHVHHVVCELWARQPGTNHVREWFSAIIRLCSRRTINWCWAPSNVPTYVRSPPCGRSLKIAGSPSLTYIAAKNLFGIMSHFWYHGPEFYGTNYGNLRWVSEGDVFERRSVKNMIWRHYEKLLCKWPVILNTRVY